MHHCATVRVGQDASADPREAANSTLRLLSRQVITQGKEMNRLRSELTDLVRRVNLVLLAAPIGVNSASTLIITTGDNPERLRSDPLFAALCGSLRSTRPQESTTAAEIVMPTMRSGGSR